MPYVPEGFELAGVPCGLKASGRDDLALIHCPQGAVAAGVYTQNLVFAAPVEVDRSRTPRSDFRICVVNAANANACTGERGLRNADEMTRLAAEACGARREQALVMSTGVIGEYLEMEKIASGIAAAHSQLGRDDDSFHAASRAITTTDKGPKITRRSLTLNGGSALLSGMAKGAGMIGPRMATMLAVVMTDAALQTDDAQQLLAAAVSASFNRISVEGHMSTNDTVLLIASGKACGEPLRGDDLSAFSAELTGACIELAKMIPDDGEGSTHLIEIEVAGCRCEADADQIARTIAASNLVKTAISGADPNWGRIVSAAGYAGPTFDPQRVSLVINGAAIYSNGVPEQFDAAALSRSIRENRETMIRLDLAGGDSSAKFWTSDLTVDYVTFNADYHT
ncbi:MAG: bifunctional glutamate N-acetyltransferase/amino-acid acetyltransferase ArgJ [Pirellulaceae bacterium]|jgi:glutamate N-acetyltransferase/amino-acid N-acetyltransferase|nr:bifunctional glutamate N-acetyltransferase/amino-acid acetyltransferase ArgJ [Pirellulaceae bacterium]MDP7016688.1 bifunctional glutamate N-acetyltransferase/amino-acid acetyltransferase ArgJ [Pirellulaceae bacterium]